MRTKDKDLYNTNNYLPTLSHLLNIAISKFDEELDTRALDSSSYNESDKQEVQINRNQFSSPPRNGGHGYKPNYNKNKNNYKKRSRSSDDDDDDNETYYINEFRDKVYKKKKTGHQKSKANSYATRVTDDSYKK